MTLRLWRSAAPLRALVIATALSAAALPFGRPSVAAPQDYRFELDGQPVKSGTKTIVKLRLVHVPDGKPVSGAIVIQTRLDMGPSGMKEMAAPAKAMPGDTGGVYQVETEPSMAGDWALTLGAKVQGEVQTVRGTVNIAVPK
jgi:YtkA-like protein